MLSAVSGLSLYYVSAVTVTYNIPYRTQFVNTQFLYSVDHTITARSAMALWRLIAAHHTTATRAKAAQPLRSSTALALGVVVWYGATAVAQHFGGVRVNATPTEQPTLRVGCESAPPNGAKQPSCEGSGEAHALSALRSGGKGGKATAQRA